MAKGEVKLVNGKRIASPEYRSWQMMKNRCQNPRAQDYAYYGGRGIIFQADWEKFDNFLRDMGRRPTPAHTLDRINSDGPYSKENCQWATRRMQAQNRKYCKLNKALADEIRKLYATGFYLQKALAALYGLTQADISQIVHGRWS